MVVHNISILCLQETRASKADYYYSENGFRVILSGTEEVQRSWTGVGFIVAPRVAHLVEGFLQFSDRLASLKIRGRGGRFGILCAYAPHNLRPYDERHHFYLELGRLLDETSVNGPKYCVGDFNARLGQRRPGEEDLLGPYCFGREAVHCVEAPNRDLFIEFCTDRGYVVANSLEETPLEQKVTYFEWGQTPMGPVSASGNAMLDLVLVPIGSDSDVSGVRSHREATLATNHYLVTFGLAFEYDTHVRKQCPSRKDRSALLQPCVRQCFVDAFRGHITEETRSVQGVWSGIKSAFYAAEKSLPDLPPKPNKPWIRPHTLSLIRLREAARSAGHDGEEKRMHKAVRKSVRSDRTAWVDACLAEGSWKAIKNFRKPRPTKQGRLRDDKDELVSSEHRADTRAAYLEKVQWRVRPAGLVDGPALGSPLPVNLNDFSTEEVKVVVRKLRNDKAAGPDAIPAEYWKAVIEDDVVLEMQTTFVNLCWRNKEIPVDWHEAQVSALHKKGRVDLCENYRPISLLCLGYKIFAALVRARIIEAGAERRLSKSQFGFRSGCGSSEAIFVLRRKIEQAWALKFGQSVILALDWQKAFDAINSDALLIALKRFGLPEHVLQVVAAIYSDRNFYVKDCGQKSSSRPQRSGISQGCPLSPFLFVMLMSVLMEDAKSKLQGEDLEMLRRGVLADLLYADDTLLLGVNGKSVENFLRAVSDAGAAYGLSLHWGKLQLMRIRCSDPVRRPDGTNIDSKDTMAYLGTNLSEDGRISRELSRRLGTASADFRAMSRMWKHTSFTRLRKLEVYQAVIVSRLLYGLASAWLSAAERRRLDGFHNRCLRALWGIRPAYVSRISNKDVLSTTSQRPMSTSLLRQQLILFGKVAREPADSVLRSAAFRPGSFWAATDGFVRTVGRPRLEWSSEVERHAVRAAGGYREMQQAVVCPGQWKVIVSSYAV